MIGCRFWDSVQSKKLAYQGYLFPPKPTSTPLTVILTIPTPACVRNPLHTPVLICVRHTRFRRSSSNDALPTPRSLSLGGPLCICRCSVYLSFRGYFGSGRSTAADCMERVRDCTTHQRTSIIPTVPLCRRQ